MGSCYCFGFSLQKLLQHLLLQVFVVIQIKRVVVVVAVVVPK